MTQQYEYLVLETRDSMFRGKQSGASLQAVLNEQAAQGWQFKHMMSDDIKGRMGLGSTSGVLMVFERAVGGESQAETYKQIQYQSSALHAISEQIQKLLVSKGI